MEGVGEKDKVRGWVVAQAGDRGYLKWTCWEVTGSGIYFGDSRDRSY